MGLHPESGGHYPAAHHIPLLGSETPQPSSPAAAAGCERACKGEKSFTAPAAPKSAAGFTATASAGCPDRSSVATIVLDSLVGMQQFRPLPGGSRSERR